MPVIQELSPHLADLIAAGEVVERPSSVAKELIENAIDAGATRISVELQHGGIAYLRITDDGCGMTAEDAPIAFRRHATSKLRTEEDLGAIGTLGFRGEALAAISSVSRIDLFTKQKGELAGTHLHLEAGEITVSEDAGCPEGTSIIVRDIFFNTPARMKFLKKDFTEANYVITVVQHAALSHPEIAFTVMRDGMRVFSTPGNDKLLSPVFSVFGREMTENMIEVQRFEQNGCAVWGYVGKAHAGRPNRSHQKFFVNGRYIRSKLMQAAVEEAYRNKIIAGKFPVCTIFLSLPLNLVDVNVHPAKTEVKFAQEKIVFDVVYVAVCNALEHADNIPQIRSKEKNTAREDNLTSHQQMMGTECDIPIDPKNFQIGEVHGLQAEDIRQVVEDARMEQYELLQEEAEKAASNIAEETSEKKLPKTFEPDPDTFQRKKNETPGTLSHLDEFFANYVRRYPEPEEIDAIRRGRANPITQLHQQSASIEKGEARIHNLNESIEAELAICSMKENERLALPTEKPAEQSVLPQPEMPQKSASVAMSAIQEREKLFSKKSVRVIGEAFKTYIIAEDEEGLLLVDKHAAHERMIFNRLRASTEIPQQRLLAPVVVDLTANEFAAVSESIEQVRCVGFDLEPFGESSVAVRAIPAYLDAGDVSSAISEIAEKLMSSRTPGLDELDDLIHMVSCKAAIKAGKSTDIRELQDFCTRVLADPEIQCCPHGRPVTVRLTKYELDKLFKRVNQ